MKQWLTGSTAYSALAPMKAVWDKVAAAFKKLNRGSVLEKLYNSALSFLGKEPRIGQSLFYRMMTCIGRLLNKAAMRLNSFFRLEFGSSGAWKIIKAAESELRVNPYVLSGLVFAGAFAGYTASVFARGAVGTRSLVVMALLFIVSLILIFVKDNIGNIIRGSLLYKVIVYFK